MRKVKLLLVLFFVFLVQILTAQVSLDTVFSVAQTFFNGRWKSLFPDSNTLFTIKSAFQVGNDANNPDYYVINFEPTGFIIIANSYASNPVLAYGFRSNLDNSSHNPAFEWWMKQRRNEINKIKQKKLPIHKNWQLYMEIQHHKNVKSVAPLLITKWDQGKYYNSACPVDPNGPDGRCVTGCVATAVSQIMYYHRWPLSGTGCHSYIHPQYGQIAACFDTCYYDYNEMTPVLTNYNYSAALLLYTTGISFDMLYGPSSSGVWNHSVANSMKAYFKFCPETRYIFRDSTNLNWDSIVRANLDARKPLYYAGWEDYTYTSGHAFVCDGYQDSGYYHFNWGWGGYADGYYYSDQLTPAGSNFTFAQELIADIYPDTILYSYPHYCSNEIVTYNSGTINTNNGSKQYLPNSNCSWLISPICGKTIQAQFYSFNLEVGDTLFVYDGENEQAPLLQFFTKSLQPILVNQTGATLLKSSGNKMFVRFKSDANLNGYGFHLYYKSHYCSVDTLTAITGIVSDGSGSCDYQNYTNCRWVIKPQNAQALKLEFTQFDLASNNTGDFVAIYKNTISSSNLIAQFNYLNPPQQSVYVPSGTAVIRFVTNSAVTAAGWEILYEDATVISDTYPKVSDIKIYPNPINASTVIEGLELNSIIELYDFTGRCIYMKNVSESSLKFKEIFPVLPKGIYMLKVKQQTFKLVNLLEY